MIKENHMKSKPAATFKTYWSEIPLADCGVLHRGYILESGAAIRTESPRHHSPHRKRSRHRSKPPKR